MDPLISDELREKYQAELGERIGHGGFGEVYRASVNGVPCAIKISLDPIDASTGWAAKELEALDTVKSIGAHPHVVTLFDIWQIEGRLITRWELGQQSLAARLEECRRQGLSGIPREDVVRYMQEAAEGIDFLNGQGVYHRDIKPENLLLFQDHVKLADLGLAKFVGASTGVHTRCGTPGYMPPELEQDRLSSTSDLYSLAATYVRLRTGHGPFGTTPREVQRRQDAGEPLLAGLEAHEAELVGQALEPRPEDRPQEGALAWVADLIEKPRKKRRRKKAWKPPAEKRPPRPGFLRWVIRLPFRCLGGAIRLFFRCFRGATKLLFIGLVAAIVAVLVFNAQRGNQAFRDGPRGESPQSVRLGLRDKHEKLASVYQAAGQPDKAIQEWTIVIGIDPEYFPAYFHRGNLYLDKGEFDKAIADYNKAIEIRLRDAASYINRGNAYHAKGDLDKAIANYTKAIGINRKEPLAYNNRGLTYHDKRHYNRAIADYNMAIKINPKYAAAYNNRGNAYLANGDPDRAMGDYNTAITIDPKYAPAYFSRGNVFFDKREFDKAIAEYHEVIEINPRYAAAHHNLALAYINKGDPDRAIWHLDTVIAFDPKDAKAYNLRGQANAKKNELDKAIADYKKATELDPELASAYANLGLAYYDKGNRSKALENFKKAAELDGQYGNVYRQLLQAPP